MAYKSRMNQETFIPEININGKWIGLDFLEDAYAIFGTDEFYEVCKEMFTDDVVDGIKEFIEQKEK